MKRTLPCTFLALVCASITLLSGCNFGGGSNNDPVDADLRIGALLDLSGDSSATTAMVEQAVQQAALNAQALGVVVGVEVRDTQGDPSIAVQQMQELLDLGIRVFVGPSTSAEAQAVLPLANASGALVVSESSTAQSLAIPNDALYRMSPTSNVESQASVDFIKLRGRTSLVTVSRDDIGNLEAVSAVRADASRAGISLQPMITYSSSQGTDFNAVARQIADAVSAAGNAATVGVYVAGFDEVAGLLADCAVIPTLQDVAFYGSDGVAQNSTINSSAKSSFFAVQADSLPSALIGVPTDKQVQAQQVTLEIGGTTPNGFVLNAYDAVSIMTNAYISNSSFGSGGAGDRTSFVKAADGYSGLTGTIELNAAGDRITALYTMWGVCYVSGLTNWYSVGSWTPNSWTSTSGVASYSGCPAT